jgi:hypothetical protein
LVLLVALQSDEAALCGPSGDDPPVRTGIDRGQAERLCRAALDQPDRHTALAFLAQALPSLDIPVPALRNEGLFALHALTIDAVAVGLCKSAELAGILISGGETAQLKDDKFDELDVTLGEELLRPTDIYVREALEILGAVRGNKQRKDYHPSHVALIGFSSRDDEADWIAEAIRALVPSEQEGALHDKKDGASRGLALSDIAVLVRSSTSVRTYMQALEAAGIARSLRWSVEL